MIGLVALLLVSQSSDEARRAEEAAFVAIDEQRWCDALREFVRAYELAPADELLFNAGLAAERAGDVERAKSLFTRVPAASAKGASAQRHLADLATARQTATCAPAVAPPPTATSTATEAQPATTTNEQQPATTTNDDEKRASGMGTLPIGLIGTGGVVALAGVIAIVSGASAYFDHEAAREAITAGERAQVDPATLLDEHARQLASREAWESWGQLAVIGGIVAIAGGAALSGGALFVAE